MKSQIKHFTTRKEAFDFLKSRGIQDGTIKVFKKSHGIRGFRTKPFVVCSEFQFLNMD